MKAIPSQEPPGPARKRGLQVRHLFARIARRYDRANRILSLASDQRWRRSTVRRLAPRPADRVLDLFCGTGDLTRMLAAAGARVVGADFCPEMIEVATERGPRHGRAGIAPPRYLAADALRLPFPDRSFDLVTAAFGVRNLEDLDAGIAEMARVIRPGGRMAVLEFGRPASAWLRALYRPYLRWCLPRLGGWITGDAPSYYYLSRSIPAFIDQDGLQRQMRGAGFDPVTRHDFSGGIASLHVGVRL